MKYTNVTLCLFNFQAIREECFGVQGDRPEAKNVAVIITDGVPFPDERRQPAIDEAEILRTEYSK